MKAERRHELKINTLDDALAKMHAEWRRYATWATTTVIVGILVGVLVHNRITAAQAKAAKALDDMATVQFEMGTIKLLIGGGGASSASEFYRDITSRLDSILATVGTGNPKLAAEALVARGDVDWYMSGAASATTQPLTDQPSSGELEKGAQAAYDQVITSYPDQHFSVNSARLGLAAIAENDHDWAEARKQFQAVIDDPQAGDIVVLLARQKLAGVDQLQNPPVIGQIPASPLSVNGPTTQN
jgi:hypothetical protein